MSDLDVKKATKSLISIKLRRALVVFGLFSTEICIENSNELSKSSFNWWSIIKIQLMNLNLRFKVFDLQES